MRPRPLAIGAGTLARAPTVTASTPAAPRVVPGRCKAERSTAFTAS
jgi:hypothetical protein